MSRFSKKTKENVNDIYTKDIQKDYQYQSEKFTIQVMGVKYSKIKEKEELLDETLVNKSIDDIAKSITSNISKYNSLPKKVVIHHNNDKKNEEHNSQNINKNEEFINCYEPRYNLEDIYIDKKSKKQILTCLTMKKYQEKLFGEWGLKDTIKNNRAIILNFFGHPGTGKSMTAEAIAKYLNKQICAVDYSQLESKYVGETPKNIKKVFEVAREKDAVIIFDEADSFLGKRLTNITQSADYGVNITRSVMLLELEKFDGVVIFTTNLITNYDDAFKRRILSSIEFKLPDEQGRKLIWKAHIPSKLPIGGDINIDLLAQYYEKVSGADIKDIVLFASVNALQRNSEIVSKCDFDLAYEYVMSRYSNGEEELEVKTEIISEEQYNEEMKELEYN